jgi:hypothetical protein
VAQSAFVAGCRRQAESDRPRAWGGPMRMGATQFSPLRFSIAGPGATVMHRPLAKVSK